MNNNEFQNITNKLWNIYDYNSLKWSQVRKGEFQFWTEPQIQTSLLKPVWSKLEFVLCSLVILSLINFRTCQEKWKQNGRNKPQSVKGGCVCFSTAGGAVVCWVGLGLYVGEKLFTRWWLVLKWFLGCCFFLFATFSGNLINIVCIPLSL